MTFRDSAVEAMEQLRRNQCAMITSDDKESYKRWSYTYFWDADWYKFSGRRALYYNLFPERVDTASKMLVVIDLQEVPGGSIVSIGCGFGAELVAAYDYLQRQNGLVPEMTFIGVDPVLGWRDCFNVFNSNRFEFWVGELSDVEQEQRALCNSLQRNRAAMVILSHVVLDFAKAYIGAVINKMFEIETLQRVVIMERLVYNDYPAAPQGCQSYDRVIWVHSGYKPRGTKIVVYERVPQSSSSDEDSSSGSDSGDNTHGQGLGSDADDAEQDHDSDVDDVAELLGGASIA